MQASSQVDSRALFALIDVSGQFTRDPSLWLQCGGFRQKDTARRRHEVDSFLKDIGIGIQIAKIDAE